MFLNRIVLVAAAAATLLFSGPSSVRAAEGATGAGSYIEGLANQTLTIIQSADNKDAKQKKLNKLFSDNVDFPWVGRFVMGRFWRQATDDQKARYLPAYQKFLILHYTSRFTEYTSGAFKVTGSKDDGEGEYTVSMRIEPGDGKQGEPILVDYRVRKEAKSGYKIFDVIVEGVSMITTQRSEFSSVLTQHDIDYLIDQLITRSQTGDINLAGGK